MKRLSVRDVTPGLTLEKEFLEKHNTRPPEKDKGGDLFGVPGVTIHIVDGGTFPLDDKIPVVETRYFFIDGILAEVMISVGDRFEKEIEPILTKQYGKSKGTLIGEWGTEGTELQFFAFTGEMLVTYSDRVLREIMHSRRLASR